jgi:hypothetical protein
MSQSTKPTLTDVVTKIEELNQNVNTFNEKFDNYQQSVQWVIQLAFTLIASATIAVIITSVSSVLKALPYIR